MQVKVAESMPKRHYVSRSNTSSNQEPLWLLIKPMEVVLSRCVCVKKNVNFRFSYRFNASKQISAWKIPPSNLFKQ